MSGADAQAEAQKDVEQERAGYRLHEENIRQSHGQQREGNAAEIIRILSDIDDLPIDPDNDPIMGQLISRLTSTTNLTSEQVRSNEWVREYILLLYLCKHPSTDGVHSEWRGWAHNGDPSAEVEPLPPQKRMELESFISLSKLALNRSEDAKVIEEGARTINESVVNDDSADSGRGGLLARLRG